MNRRSAMKPRVTGTVNGASSRRLLWRVYLLLLPALAVMTSCALKRPPLEEEPIVVQPGGASLLVRNRNWSTMHIYLLAAGQRFSMGLVTSQSERAFEIPPTAFANDRNISLMADPVGSNLAYVSEPILVQPGDQIRLTLEMSLNQSNISIF